MESVSISATSVGASSPKDKPSTTYSFNRPPPTSPTQANASGAVCPQPPDPESTDCPLPICPSKSANDSGSSATIEYKFSVCGLLKFAYGTATGTADQSELSHRPKREE